MKSSLAILITFVVLSEYCRQCDSKERFRDKLNWWSIKSAFKNIHSSVGNALVNMRRIFQFRWKRTRNYFDKSFVLNREDAAYFFYKEQKARDQIISYMQQDLEEQEKQRDEARRGIRRNIFSFNFFNAFRKFVKWLHLRHRVKYTKKNINTAEDLQLQEHFCNHPEINPANFCRMALENKKLRRLFPVVSAITEKEPPICEIMSVYLPEYDFKAERNFLRCPIVRNTADPSLSSYEKQHYMYISSVDDPPAYRMRFYLFTSPLLDLDDFSERPPPIAKTGLYDNNLPRQYENTPKSAPYSPPRQAESFQAVKSRPTSPEHRLYPKVEMYEADYPPPQDVKTKPVSPDRQSNNSPKSESGSPPRSNKWFPGFRSRPTSPDRQSDGSQKTETGSPPHQFQGTQSKPSSPDRQSDTGSNKKNIFSFLSKKPNETEDLLPLQILTLALNKDRRAMKVHAE